MQNKSNPAASENEQLDFGLREPFSNKFYKLKNKLLLRLRRFETRKFIRTPYVWMIIIVSVTMVIAQFSLIETYSKLLPPEIPLFLSFRNLEERLSSNKGLIIIFYQSLMIFILSILTANRGYNKKPYLANLNLLSMLFSIFMMTVLLIRFIGRNQIQ